MATEYCNDNKPAYMHNKNTSYENTVLQEHYSIVTGLRETATYEALLENTGTLYIGLALKHISYDFIKSRYSKYLKEEMENITDASNVTAKRGTAINRTWERIINEATAIWMDRYKVDGSKAKIAVLDIETFDGRPIVEVEEEPIVQFSDGEE